MFALTATVIVVKKNSVQIDTIKIFFMVGYNPLNIVNNYKIV